VKYLCLAYEGEDTFNDMPVAEWEAVREETLAYVEALKRSGQLIDARPLRSATTAATLKVRNGQLSVTDGPFAETKEQLGGYFLIEARVLNEAISDRLEVAWRASRRDRSVAGRRRITARGPLQLNDRR
jgi:hypothetical protein